MDLSIKLFSEDFNISDDASLRFLYFFVGEEKSTTSDNTILGSRINLDFIHIPLEIFFVYYVKA